MAGPIKFTSVQRIADHLVERLPGELYDVYYKSLEELVTLHLDGQTNTLINDSFITQAGDEGLKRWQAFYEEKPSDMSYDSWRRLLLICNKLAVHGPTDNNVLELLQFFDSTATFSAIKPRPLYAGRGGRITCTITASGTATDALTTIYDYTTTAAITANAIITTAGASPTVYFSTPKTVPDFVLATTLSGDKLLTTVTWNVTPPAAGTTYTLNMYSPDYSADKPVSAFLNRFTAQYPTQPYYIYDHHSIFAKTNQFITYASSFVAYETSAMNVTKLSHRALLRALLDKLLPANVTFILRWAAVQSVVYVGNGLATDPNRGKVLWLYEPSYGTASEYEIRVNAQGDNSTLTNAIVIGSNKVLVELNGLNGWPICDYYIYDLITKESQSLFRTGYSSSPIFETRNNRIWMPRVGSNVKKMYQYDIDKALLSVEDEPVESNETVTAANVSQNGHGLLGVNTVTSTQRIAKVYVLNLDTNAILQTHEVPALQLGISTYIINSVYAINENLCLVTHFNPVTKVSYVTYVNNTTGTVIETQYSDSGVGLVKDNIIITDFNNIYFATNNKTTHVMNIYKCAYGENPFITTPVLTLNINGTMFKDGVNLLVANASKQLITVAGFFTGSTTTVYNFLSELTSPTVKPVGILEAV